MIQDKLSDFKKVTKSSVFLLVIYKKN